MKTQISALMAALGLCTIGTARADCAADATVAETKQSFARAQKLESAGNAAGAFHAYVAAQAYTCDPNPVEAQAAQRAAPLALRLGSEAEKKGDFERAFDIYDAGGQYSAGDRALLAWVRVNPDSPAVFNKAREATSYRELPAFAANNKVRLNVTGAYKLDTQLVAEVRAMPQKGFERALKKEAEAFNEEYLRGIVQRDQTRPDDPTDMGATQAWMNTQQSFIQKWSQYPEGDPLKASRSSLSLARTWAAATYDQTLSAKLEAQLNQRQELRATTLAKSFAGAPDLLDAAIDYQMSVLSADDAAKRKRADAIRTQAGQLGDAANAKQRFLLAAGYYRVANLDAKAQAANDAYQQLARTKMQPQIDQMKLQAERIQKEFSDPAKVQAMREQAQAMQKSLQQQQQANAKGNTKKSDDLEKELGL